MTSVLNQSHQERLQNQLQESWQRHGHRWPGAESLWRGVAVPLSLQIANKQELSVNNRSQCAFTLGISGTQGSGKSTLADMLECLLNTYWPLTVVNVSLDDFYFSHHKRQQMSQKIHPLLATRGVPGTHDVAFGIELFHKLQSDSSAVLAIPRFNKATDDPMPATQWPTFTGPVDVILFEGWCLNVTPQEESELEMPLNALEEEEDSAGIWRRYVNDQLRGLYQDWFAMVDEWVWLNAQSFDVVYDWRCQQEGELKRATKGDQASAIMSAADLKRFIQHYERLTRHSFDCLPDRVDHEVVFAADRSIKSNTMTSLRT